MKFKDIFLTSSEQEKYKPEELYSLPIHHSFIAMLADHLQITYKEDYSTENTCFADSRELRADYRTTFSHNDVLHYILRQIGENAMGKEQLQIKMPENAREFFKK